MKPNVQTSRMAPAAATRRCPHVNALTHGLRRGSVLLPGDNVAAFRTLRRRLFVLHQPRTIEEAQCVETIAAAHWRIARCRREQAIFKHHLGAVMSGDPAVSGYLCDADPHRLHHRGADCMLEEGRLERFKCRAHAALAGLQRQRTQNLIPGREHLLDDAAVFLAEGEPPAEAWAAEQEAEAAGPVPEAQAVEPETPPASASHHGENRKIRKRDAEPLAVTPSAPWNRRQRRTARHAARQASRRNRRGTPVRGGPEPSRA